MDENIIRRSQDTVMSNGLQYFICYLNGRRYFLIENKKLEKYYSLFPENATIVKEANRLKATLVDKRKLLSLKSCLGLNTLFKYPPVKTLIFKGLGLKINADYRNRNLELKLGYSHRSNVPMVRGIKIATTKNSIMGQSINKVKLGNYLYNIRKLRFPNTYKGKGIWYEDEVKILKPIKKK